MTAPLAPGSTIGILGTGQLGRMLASAAARLGFRVETYGPDADPPASRVAARHHAAAYDDEDALVRFARGIDVATFEFENIAARTIAVVSEAGTPVRPNERVLAVCQDRVLEKDYLNRIGIATAPYEAVDDLPALTDALGRLGVPAILKTRRFGYDGKGQTRLKGRENASEAFAKIGAGAILEGFVAFDGEISQIAARGVDGTKAYFDCPLNVHRDGILRESHVPAEIDPILLTRARDVVGAILDDLDYVGVIAVEFFWSRDEGLIANEIAPRVHNSGHWTVEACAASQFEQHIRAVAGWPLADPSRHSGATMANLIGEEALSWHGLVSDPNLSVTLYGKANCRPGRKMGHTVRLDRTRAD